ncbi:hypothetical protein RIF29_13893 [Crotalaria pallida]|uniref:Transmembrane protein n=1 Tax=Crotalaria pallida TaxID=3830 RepID=A0AAN9FJ37_CROPI
MESPKEKIDLTPSVPHDRESYKELKSIIWKQEKTVRQLETRATNLVISYVFFQGLMLLLLCVSDRQRVKCGHWWIPLSLLSTVAVMFFTAFISILREWSKTLYYTDMNWIELETTHLLSLQEDLEVEDNKNNTAKKDDPQSSTTQEEARIEIEAAPSTGGAIADPPSIEGAAVKGSASTAALSTGGEGAASSSTSTSGKDKELEESSERGRVKLPEPSVMEIYKRDVFSRSFACGLLGYTAVILVASRIVVCGHL